MLAEIVIVRFFNKSAVILYLFINIFTKGRKLKMKPHHVLISRPGVPNRGPSGPPGGHGALKGATGTKSNFGGPWKILGGPQHNK